MHHSSVVLETVIGVVTLLLVATGIRALTKLTKLPFSIILVLTGMAFSWLSQTYPEASPLLPSLEISPDIIMYVFLPTLVFESAFCMDTHMLRENLRQVLALAVPGLLLSTGLTGYIIHLATGIPLAESFLLGAILSATDPVAVVALFKQLGTPLRLTVLVEGESLFNDATAIVVSRILIAVVAAGNITFGTLLHGASDLFVVFIGGVVAGWFLGLLTGYILGMVESDPFIEITLTTVLAYLSFVIAEEMLHVSGVMATVTAGLTMGGWGRMKISPSVRSYMEHFWEYLAFVANALIFLMVGLHIKISAIANSFEMILWVILAMSISRAVIIFGIVPIVGKRSESEPVSLRYQTVMFWGGLRGAIALAIVLSLPDFEYYEIFVTLVTGAVLYTLIVQGLTMDMLVRFLGLNIPPLSDRFAFLEGSLSSKLTAQERVPELMKGGQFSGSIAKRLQEENSREIEEIRKKIDFLQQSELTPEHERQLLMLFSFAKEKSMFIEMFNKGHISERAFRELEQILSLHVDALRHSREVEHVQAYNLPQRRLERLAIYLAERTPGLSTVAESIRRLRIAKDYEMAWGRYQGSGWVLQQINDLAKLKSFPEESVKEAFNLYKRWHEMSGEILDQTAEQFPEFVNTVQERIGKRLLLQSESEAIARQAEHGFLTQGVAEKMQKKVAEKLRALKGIEISKLKFEPYELLRKVPFFNEIPDKEYGQIVEHTITRSFSGKDFIIRQGEEGNSLFLIARGVVRVSRSDEGKSRDLATLMAGDFFGEMALLHAEPRTATVRAVTSCLLYELNQKDLFTAMETCPSIRSALEEADRQRKSEMKKTD